MRNSPNQNSLIEQFKSHRVLLNYLTQSKDSVLKELQVLIKNHEFEKLNVRYFSGLLNTNNSIYLFMGFLVKYIRQKYLNPASNSQEVINEALQQIEYIKVNFFHAISKLKQKFNKKNNLSVVKSNIKNAAKIQSNFHSNDAKKPNVYNLEYTSIFLKISSNNLKIKTIIDEILMKYFSQDPEVLELVNKTIKLANEKKMRDIVNLSKSLAVIETNTQEKIFAILECLLNSNELLRPVSFTEIKDAFQNVQKVFRM